MSRAIYTLSDLNALYAVEAEQEVRAWLEVLSGDSVWSRATPRSWRSADFYALCQALRDSLNELCRHPRLQQRQKGLMSPASPIPGLRTSPARHAGTRSIGRSCHLRPDPKEIAIRAYVRGGPRERHCQSESGFWNYSLRGSNYDALSVRASSVVMTCTSVHGGGSDECSSRNRLRPTKA
jgi:hypothetical protein